MKIIKNFWSIMEFGFAKFICYFSTLLIIFYWNTTLFGLATKIKWKFPITPWTIHILLFKSLKNPRFTPKSSINHKDWDIPKVLHLHPFSNCTKSNKLNRWIIPSKWYLSKIIQDHSDTFSIQANFYDQIQMSEKHQ